MMVPDRVMDAIDTIRDYLYEAGFNDCRLEVTYKSYFLERREPIRTRDYDGDGYDD